MKPSVFIACAVAVVAIAACNSKQGDAATNSTAKLEQVGLAAAIGTDDTRQAWLDPQFGRLNETLEAAELEPP